MVLHKKNVMYLTHKIQESIETLQIEWAMAFENYQSNTYIYKHAIHYVIESSSPWNTGIKVLKVLTHWNQWIISNFTRPSSILSSISSNFTCITSFYRHWDKAPTTDIPEGYSSSFLQVSEFKSWISFQTPWFLNSISQLCNTFTKFKFIISAQWSKDMLIQSSQLSWDCTFE